MFRYFQSLHSSLSQCLFSLCQKAVLNKVASSLPVNCGHWTRCTLSLDLMYAQIIYYQYLTKDKTKIGLPWWLSGKESTWSAGSTGNTGSILGLGRSPGGGHGNPLQYSCLENLTDRGAWQATIHRVAKSQTWLKWLSRHTCKAQIVCISMYWNTLKVDWCYASSCPLKMLFNDELHHLFGWNVESSVSTSYSQTGLCGPLPTTFSRG